MIALDQVPSRSSVRPGSRVIAMWKDGNYYPGKVASVSADSYEIQFDDGDRGSVSLDKIRLR